MEIIRCRLSDKKIPFKDLQIELKCPTKCEHCGMLKVGYEVQK